MVRDRKTDRTTDRPTDIATYRAAIAAKNKLSLKQFLIANHLMKLNVSYFSLNKIKNRKISKK